MTKPVNSKVNAHSHFNSQKGTHFIDSRRGHGGYTQKNQQSNPISDYVKDGIGCNDGIFCTS